MRGLDQGEGLGHIPSMIKNRHRQPSPLMPLVIAGATGSGKSALALELALRHRGEIICADSRQFYLGMSIGTASPGDHERALVAHHGFNSIDPLNIKFDAGLFIDFAKQQIAQVQARGHRPILVGGTGLYLRALRYGFGQVPRSDELIVAELEVECANYGLEHLYQQLLKLDPISVLFIKATDKYRIIRALEIYRQIGQIPSERRKSFLGPPQLKAHYLLKKLAKAELQLKLYERVAHMFKQGLVEEALALRARLPEQHWALKVMGYQEALLVADGHLDNNQAIERTFIRHRQYAKRQATWFNKENFYVWGAH